MIPDIANQQGKQRITWHWLRGLLKVIDELKNADQITKKIQESLKHYLALKEVQVYIVENSSIDTRDQIDKLASSNFFNRTVIEDIFIHKQPCHQSSREIIFPLECFGRVLGLAFVESESEIDESTYQLLWSFWDQVAIKIHDLQMPHGLNPESKTQIREISDSIFNNLKSFLEASLERLKVLEEQNLQLMESNKTRTELINNVSHELRTPLVSIMGFSNILQRHEISPELIKESSQQIQSAGSRLSRMIDDLIQLNRASTKGWEIHVEKLDIGEIARFVVDTLSPLNKNHQFTFRFPDDYPLINGDRRLLRQVLENLLINAIKYSPNGGEINCAIRIDASSKSLFLVASDHGIGMTPEENSKVFERFYRAKNPKTENIPGLGLGLTICKDIVEAMNGEITSESVFEEGSRFTISFPY